MSKPIPLILSGFLGAQAGWLRRHSYRYLVMNLVGALALAIVAVLTEDWGFVLLEGVWAIVSASGLSARLAGEAPAGH